MSLNSDIDYVKLGLKSLKTCVYIHFIYMFFYLNMTIFIAEPFEETEEKWLSSLENTRWLEYVRFVQPLSFFFF